MKRRSFLKFLGMAPAVPVIAKAAEKFPEYPEYTDEPGPPEYEEKWRSVATEDAMMFSVVAEPLFIKDLKRRIK